MAKLIDSICKLRDLMVDGKPHELRQAFGSNGLADRIIQRTSQEIKRKFNDRSRELEFTYQDLAELSDDGYALLQRWTDAIDGREHIKRIVKEVANGNRDVNFNSYSEKHVLPWLALRRDCIVHLYELLSVLNHHLVFLYLLEEVSKDDAREFTIRYGMEDDGTIAPIKKS